MYAKIVNFVTFVLIVVLTIEDPNNIYSKPLKCGYSPYTNQWEEWSTNPLKQQAIEFYGMQELVKKDA